MMLRIGAICISFVALALILTSFFVDEKDAEKLLKGGQLLSAVIMFGYTYFQFKKWRAQ
jgi:hypothetical protein